MNAISAGVLSSRMCQLVPFGIEKWHEGEEYLDSSFPDPLGSLGTMLQSCALVPDTVSDQEVTTVSNWTVTTSCATVGFVQPWVVWARRWAGREAAAGNSWTAKLFLCTSLGCVRKFTCAGHTDDTAKRVPVSSWWTIPWGQQEGMPV